MSTLPSDRKGGRTCSSCGVKLRSSDRGDRRYCGGTCRMRAMRARGSPDSAWLEPLASAIERFLESRVLRAGTVGTRTGGQEEPLELILALAIDTQARVIRRRGRNQH